MLELLKVGRKSRDGTGKEVDRKTMDEMGGEDREERREDGRQRMGVGCCDHKLDLGSLQCLGLVLCACLAAGHYQRDIKNIFFTS